MSEEPYLPAETVITAPSRVRRVSWGAIFAGTFVGLVFQIMFMLLGAGIGFSTLQSDTTATSGQGMALGSAIWLLVTSLIAIWLGACVAGRLSGGPGRADGMLHGIVTWSISTLTMFALLAAGIGAVLGGAGALLGSAGTLGSSVQGQSSQSGQNAVASVQEAIKGAFPQSGSLLPPTGRTPSGRQAPGQLTEMAQKDPELAAALARLESAGGASQAPQARDQLVNLLISKHNLSQQDAANLVNQWDQQFQQARTQIGQKAKQVGQAAAHDISQGALWSFIALLLGMLAAAWGGWAGTASLAEATVVTT
ncbi:MAG TPA: hypothetical protein VL361_15330 [Candidatus Limnocylindrales bacterium]|jgi:hypothetical protein|nr:hypothetical protein [Candidatus Limnocylindrales bacterium]